MLQQLPHGIPGHPVPDAEGLQTHRLHVGTDAAHHAGPVPGLCDRHDRKQLPDRQGGRDPGNAARRQGTRI